MNEGLDHGDEAWCQLGGPVYGRIGDFREQAVSRAREHCYAVWILPVMAGEETRRPPDFRGREPKHPMLPAGPEPGTGPGTGEDNRPVPERPGVGDLIERAGRLEQLLFGRGRGAAVQIFSGLRPDVCGSGLGRL